MRATMAGLMLVAMTAGIARSSPPTAARGDDPPPPSVVVWTGAGDGTSIDDPDNWSREGKATLLDPDAIDVRLVVDDPAARIGGEAGVPAVTFVGDGGLEMHDGEWLGLGMTQRLSGGDLVMRGGRVERRYVNDVAIRLEGWGRLELADGMSPLRGGTTVDLRSTGCGLDLRFCPRARFLSDIAWRCRVGGGLAIPGVNLRVDTWNDDQGCTVSVMAEACPADLDGDLAVGGADLGLLLGAWGDLPDGDGDDVTPAVDIVPDGRVDGADLGVLLGSWGPCPTGPEVPECGDPGHCDLWYPPEP